MRRWTRLGILMGSAIFVMGLISPVVKAGGLKLSGRWWTPLGVLKVTQKGKKVTGTINWRCKTCPFKRGQKVFKGVLLEDSLSGMMRYCLKGKGCKGAGWAPLVMLVAREGRVLSGAAHFKKSECKIGGKGKKDGLVMRKLRRKRKPKPPKVKTVDGGVADASGGDKTPGDKTTGDKTPGDKTPGDKTPGDKTPGDETSDDSLVDEQGDSMEAEVAAVDPKKYEANSGSWQKEMEEGAGFMEAGRFERARRKFHGATTLDPTRPEAFNGIGVTYYARQDYEEALNWYKKSLEVDPNFGDAYYNMACIYSLQKKTNLAFRYLHIAALNGFVQPQVLTEDADLNNIRSDKRYHKIMKKMQTGTP